MKAAISFLEKRCLEEGKARIIWNVVTGIQGVVGYNIINGCMDVFIDDEIKTFLSRGNDDSEEIKKFEIIRLQKSISTILKFAGFVLTPLFFIVVFSITLGSGR